jgi:hypothetical protein
MADMHAFCGDKGGTGKSFVCTSAVQYLLDHGQEFILFETDRSNPDVKRRYDALTHCQVGIFSEGERYEDTANAIFNAASQTRTLINLPAQVFIPLKHWFEQNDLLTLAPEIGVKFFFWFVSDGGYDSLNLLKKHLEFFGSGVQFIVIKNYGRSEDFEALEQDKPLQKLLKQHKAITLNFPKFIGSVVRNRIDGESLSFGAALEHPEFGVIERQRIRKFLREAYAEFERAGVFG